MGIKVVLLCVIAACSYGIIHDQITARVCLEYFTVAHPPLFPTRSVTLLAFAWGIAATAGPGLVFGLVLASLSQSGHAPVYPVSRLLTYIALLLVSLECARPTRRYLNLPKEPPSDPARRDPGNTDRLHHLDEIRSALGFVVKETIPDSL